MVPTASDTNAPGESSLANAMRACGGLPQLASPAFVYEEETLLRSLSHIHHLRSTSSCSVLFAVKSFTYSDALRLMAPRLDGFAVSSLFEAQLARDILGTSGQVHITSPAMRPDEINSIASLCDFISFNSLGQWKRYRGILSPKANCGLRVNPNLSFVQDERYNPCRQHSKLGVPLEQLVTAAENSPGDLRGLKGLLFHSNCDSNDLSQLRATVCHLETRLRGMLTTLEWINLGGGYLYEESNSLNMVGEVADYLESQYRLKVFVEPGAALVRSAGYVVSTVLDIFQSDGKEVAILNAVGTGLVRVPCIRQCYP
jgi:carboxynorspermidine decarboxylase